MSASDIAKIGNHVALQYDGAHVGTYALFTDAAKISALFGDHK